jgi:hypothetical protein
MCTPSMLAAALFAQLSDANSFALWIMHATMHTEVYEAASA